MALTTEDRQRVTNGLQRHWSNIWEVMPYSSDELLAAVGATDDWIEDNQASFNAALPEAFRTAADLVQKTLLFCAVALARVSIALLRRVLGEVD